MVIWACWCVADCIGPCGISNVCYFLQRPGCTQSLIWTLCGASKLDTANRRPRVTVLPCLHFTSDPTKNYSLSQTPACFRLAFPHVRGSEVEARERSTFTGALFAALSHSLARSLLVPGKIQKPLVIDFEDTLHHTTHFRLTTSLSLRYTSRNTYRYATILYLS